MCDTFYGNTGKTYLHKLNVCCILCEMCECVIKGKKYISAGYKKYFKCYNNKENYIKKYA